MEPGILNRRVTLYRRESKLDVAADGRGSGEEIGEWRPLLSNSNVWARVQPFTGGEGFSADQVVATSTKEFTIYFRVDVLRDGVRMRVLYEGQAYDVVDVVEIGDREGLRLRAVARAEG